MNTMNVEGAARESVGEAKEMVGDLLDDPATKLSGQAQALCGKSQQLAADAAVVARDMMAERPLLFLGAVAAIAFAVGAVWRGGRD